MFVSNKRVYFKFVVVTKRLIAVENVAKASSDQCLCKSNPVEKHLFPVNNQQLFKNYLVIHRLCKMLLTSRTKVFVLSSF